VCVSVCVSVCVCVCVELESFTFDDRRIFVCVWCVCVVDF